MDQTHKTGSKRTVGGSDLFGHRPCFTQKIFRRDLNDVVLRRWEMRNFEGVCQGAARETFRSFVFGSVFDDILCDFFLRRNPVKRNGISVCDNAGN